MMYLHAFSKRENRKWFNYFIPHLVLDRLQDKDNFFLAIPRYKPHPWVKLPSTMYPHRDVTTNGVQYSSL